MYKRLLVALFTLIVFVSIAQQPRQVSASPVELKKFLRDYLNASGGPPNASTRVTIVSVPTRDGVSKEQVVYVSGQGWCGSGGCTLLILERSVDTFKILGDLSVIQLPVKLMPTVRHGHPDLDVVVRGDEAGEGHTAQLSFDGISYPKDASTLPAIVLQTDVGRKIITEQTRSELLYR